MEMVELAEETNHGESPDYKELLQILNDFEVVILPLVQLVYRLVIGPYNSNLIARVNL
jgi:hypothetical protein